MIPGGEGMPDMQELLQQAQQMQNAYMTAQQELTEAEVSASAGGGLVSATVSGTGEFRRVKIDPAAVDADDVETLEDLVGAAIAAACDEARKLAEAKLGPINDQLGGLSGGLGLPGA